MEEDNQISSGKPNAAKSNGPDSTDASMISALQPQNDPHRLGGVADDDGDGKKNLWRSLLKSVG